MTFKQEFVCLLDKTALTVQWGENTNMKGEGK